MTRITTRLLLNALVAAAFLASFAPAPADAATLRPTRFDDPPPNGCLPTDCSLREAVIAANASADVTSIELDEGTYNLGIEGRDEDASLTGDLDLTRPVGIYGTGRGLTIIDAGGIDRAFHVVPATGSAPTSGLVALTVAGGHAASSASADGGRGGALYVPSAVAFELEDVELSGNSADLQGGAVYSSESSVIVLGASRVTENHAEDGGAFYSTGDLHLGDGVIADNTATGSGGGVLIAGGRLSSYGEISGNSANLGGGIAVEDGVLELTQALVAHNTSATDGGGVHTSGEATIVGTELRDNVAGRGGGGIFHSGTMLTLGYSTISGNSAERGGGVFTVGDSDFENATVSDNHAGVVGGVFIDRGDAGLRYVTIAENTAGIGIGTALGNDGGSIAISGSIVAGSGEACGGEIESLGYNVDSGMSCPFDGVGDHSNADPMLAPLADNFLPEYAGLHAWTHALLPGSPAIDAGPELDCPAFDQRLERRPQDGDDDRRTFCDSGAYEKSGPPCLLYADIDRDGSVTSRDALLVLQRHAGLIQGLPCPGDINGDHRIDSLDARQILRIAADLVGF